MRTISAHCKKLKQSASARMHSFRKATAGVVSIEAALMFPFMILLLLGMLDVTHAISAKRKVTIATSAIVDLTTQMATTVDANTIEGYFDAVDNIIRPYDPANASIQLYGYWRDDNDNVVLDWQHSRGNCSGGSGYDQATLEDLTAQDNDIVVAKVCYNFTPLVGYVLAQAGFTMEETIAQRPRQSDDLACNDCDTPSDRD